MIINEFSTEWNTLAKYASKIVSTSKGKIKTFINDLKSYITNDKMMRNYTSSTYSKALSKAQRLKPKRLSMAKDQGTSDQSSLVTLV